MLLNTIGLVFSFSATNLFSQTLPVHIYTIRDGLPSNHIIALHQDSKRFPWIGTDEGLCVYDGIAFKIYTTLDGLPNAFITGSIESRKSRGTIRIATITTGSQGTPTASLQLSATAETFRELAQTMPLKMMMERSEVMRHPVSLELLKSHSGTCRSSRRNLSVTTMLSMYRMDRYSLVLIIATT